MQQRKLESDGALFLALSRDLLCVVGADGHFERVGAACAILGYSQAEMRALAFDELVHADDRAATRAELAKLEEGVDAVHFENRYLCRDGSHKWLLWTATRSAGGTLHALGRDLTERKLVEAQLRETVEALRHNEEQQRLILEFAHDAFFALDDDGLVIGWNAQAEITFGWPAVEAIGRPINDFITASLQSETAGIEHVLTSSPIEGKRVEVQAVHRDGHEFPVEMTLSSFRSAGSHMFSAFIHDISERRRIEQRLHHMATHDSLTNPPNRQLLSDRLSQALTRPGWHDRLVGVMFLDLNRFKIINDTLGHHVGDALLVGVAERLTGAIRGGDTVARLGGDEFVLILADVARRSDLDMIAAKLNALFDEPFRIGAHELQVSASIGISVFPDDGRDAEALLKSADSAMYGAKQKGREPERAVAVHEDQYRLSTGSAR